MAILNRNALLNARTLGRIYVPDSSTEDIGPNSIDLRLGDQLLEVIANDSCFNNDGEVQMLINPWKEPKTVDLTEEFQNQGVILLPGCLYLGCTKERAGSNQYVPMIEGKSSVGRFGLFVHISAGFGDQGFRGQWTLELTPVHPVLVKPGMPICQVFYHTVEGIPGKTYDETGHYNDQQGPVPSKYWLNNKEPGK